MQIYKSFLKFAWKTGFFPLLFYERKSFWLYNESFFNRLFFRDNHSKYR
jgi:hypothetical protein